MGITPAPWTAGSCHSSGEKGPVSLDSFPKGPPSYSSPVGSSQGVPSSGWDEPFSPAEGPPPTRTGLCHLANEQQPLKNPQKCLCSRGTSGVRSQRLRWFSQRVCSLVKSAPPSPPLPKPRKLMGQETDGGETNVCWLPPLFEGRF